MKSTSDIQILVCVKYISKSDENYPLGSLDPETYVNTQDLIALEGALRVKDEHRAKITALTVGPGEASKALRICFNKGCDDGIHIDLSKLIELDSFCISTIIAKCIKASHYDLILFGNQSQDGTSGLVPIYTSEMLRSPLYRDVEKFSLNKEQKAITIYRRLPNKDKEVLKCMIPCALSFVEGAMEIRLSNMDFILKAQKKPVNVINLNSLEINEESLKHKNRVKNILLQEGKIRKKYPLLPYINLTAFGRINYIISGGMTDHKKGKKIKADSQLLVSALLDYLKILNIIQNRCCPN